MVFLYKSLSVGKVCDFHPQLSTQNAPDSRNSEMDLNALAAIL